MKELNYQYKIIEEKNINGKNILKIKDDIYDKTIFMEIYKITDSNDWDESNEAEQEIGKLKDSGKISDYFVNDDYSSGVKTFYKIYEDYDGYSDSSTDNLIPQEAVNEQMQEDLSNIAFNDNLSDPIFRDDNNYQLGDLTDTIGSGYQKNAQDSLSSNSNADRFINEKREFDALGNSVASHETKEVETVVKNDLVQKSEPKLNSYTSKNNQAELERIKKLSNKPSYKTTNTNSYTYRSQNTKSKKSGKGGGFIFFIIIIGIIGVIFYTNKPQKHYHRYRANINNYRKGADYYKKASYYSAEIYFKKACNYDKDKRACSMLGFIYETGKVYKSKTTKYQIAVDYYIKGCVLNDAYSCKQAGFLSRKKLKNYKYSAKYSQRGCELNNAESCTDAGYVFEVKLKNIEKAKTLYEKGCKLKNKTACNNLALVYHYDKIKGIKNIKKAKELYAKACKLGNKKSCNIKFGTNTNDKKDIEISDNPEELFKLAWTYQNKKDYFNANLLFSKACAKNHVKSCNNLGYNYEVGNGYSKSLLMAKKYFLQGCAKKSGYACNKIGYFYETGIEFKKDLKQARKFYKKSCNLDYGLACNNLAKIFEYGKGIKKDMASAKFLYKKACKLGYKKACK